LHEDETSYRIDVADDGVGLPEGKTWPMRGKLGELIFQTLRENTRDAQVAVETSPAKGTRVTINFEHKNPMPKLQ
jgi:two-component sensor histidine kinase